MGASQGESRGNLNRKMLKYQVVEVHISCILTVILTLTLRIRWTFVTRKGEGGGGGGDRTNPSNHPSCLRS